MIEKSALSKTYSDMNKRAGKRNKVIYIIWGIDQNQHV